jgi:hypothetical protein
VGETGYVTTRIGTTAAYRSSNGLSGSSTMAKVVPLLKTKDRVYAGKAAVEASRMW